MIIELGKKQKLSGIDANTLSNTLADNDYSLVEVTVKQGLSHAKLEEWYDNGDEINNFIGCIEVTEDEMNEKVPDNFPESCKSLDDDGNCTEQQTWLEYCGLYSPNGKCLRKSINDKYLLEIGHRDEYGNKGVVTNELFRLFAGHFGIESVLTKSEMANIDSRKRLSELAKNYTLEDINAMTVADLDSVIDEIEALGFELHTSSMLKADKQDLILTTFGLKIDDMA